MDGLFVCWLLLVVFFFSIEFCTDWQFTLAVHQFSIVVETGEVLMRRRRERERRKAAGDGKGCSQRVDNF